MIDHKWFDTAASTDRDRVKYGYDQNSNRTWRQNTLATGHDAFYTYDVFNRLTDIQRGTLAGTAPNYTGVTGPTFAQQWTLDALGNWSTFKQDSNGGAPGSWDLAQNRSHNKANETTVVSGYIGLDWVDPVHDAAGNMTTLPKPNDPTKGYTAVYDAWNRLVEVRDGTSGATVAKYEYDGLGRRIVKQEYDTPGTYSRDRHYYYTIGWQVVEERIDASTSADRQFVWGLIYVDNLILRDRDVVAGGNLGVIGSGLDERLYALQDANFNVTTIVDANGNAVERYRYTPYGERTVLDASFVVQSAGSSVDWEVGHQGLFHDAETGLIQNRARMLHPILGRFMQRDPLGYVDGMSMYQYVGSSPIDFLDPWGLQASGEPDAIFGDYCPIGGDPITADNLADALDVTLVAANLVTLETEKAIDQAISSILGGLSSIPPGAGMGLTIPPGAFGGTSPLLQGTPILTTISGLANLFNGPLKQHISDINTQIQQRIDLMNRLNRPATGGN